MADPLLDALHYLCHHYGQPRSAKSLLEGLPLQDGLLVPHLLPRAANNAGFEAEEANISLPQLSPLLLPVIALLDSNRACVLLDIDQEKQQAEIAVPSEQSIGTPNAPDSGPPKGTSWISSMNWNSNFSIGSSFSSCRFSLMPVANRPPDNQRQMLHRFTEQKVRARHGSGRPYGNPNPSTVTYSSPQHCSMSLPLLFRCSPG